MAVYVYCILVEDSTWDYRMRFFLDGDLAGNFTQSRDPPQEQWTYRYGVLVYGNDSLAPGPHKITIVNGETNGVNALILLDYIIYRYVC